MDFLGLCRDFNIEVVGSEHHHVSKGWVGVHCPFCAGGRNFHLGYNESSGAFSCWRCGPHPIRETLERLTGQSSSIILSKYGGKGRVGRRPKRKKKRVATQPSLKLPDGFLEPKLRQSHRKYLRSRGFDPKFLIEEWGLTSTTPVAKLEKVSYQNRIFIPIHWDGAMVSFQARATGDASAKYKACPVESESVPARSIVYRHPLALSSAGICVEGPTDVWRIGRHAFAPLGIGYSQAQAHTIAKLYKRVMVVFDPEPLAQQRARKISDRLRMHGVDAWVHELQGDEDPGSLSPEDAQHLVELLFKRPST